MDTTTAHTVTTVGLLRFAHLLLGAYLAVEGATRPIDRKTGSARFRGMCEAADRLGLAHTPDHAHMMVMDSVREAGPRPGYRAMGNDEQKAWDDRVAGRIATRIEKGEIV